VSSVQNHQHPSASFQIMDDTVTIPNLLDSITQWYPMYSPAIIEQQGGWKRRHKQHSWAPMPCESLCLESSFVWPKLHFVAEKSHPIQFDWHLGTERDIWDGKQRTPWSASASRRHFHIAMILELLAALAKIAVGITGMSWGATWRTISAYPNDGFGTNTAWF
jgi:hypothetical protein